MMLVSGYQLDLQDGNFSGLIGFNKLLITKTSYRDKLLDITRGVDSLLVHSSLTSDSIVSGRSPDVIFKFSMKNYTHLAKSPDDASLIKLIFERIIK